jgi:hypothetical protein
MSDLVAMSRVPLMRFLRLRRLRVPIALWAIFAVAIAAFGGGTDRVMRGAFGALVIPLLSYAVVSAALGGAGLRVACRGLVALGAPPVRAARATVLVAMAVSGAVCAVLAALVCILAHRPGDPQIASDVVGSAGSSLLGGVAYAAFFSAGSAFRTGALRGLLLVVDWLLGSSGGFGAVLSPRGHLLSLLGGARCYDLSRRTSSVFLVLLSVVFFAAAVRLARRTR